MYDINGIEFADCAALSFPVKIHAGNPRLF